MKKSLLIGALCTAFTLTTVVEANESQGTDAAAKAETAEPAVRSGKEVYESVCMACHATEGPATIAPPIFAVKNHVIQVYPERDAFVQRVIDWVKAPNADDPLMKGAVKKFGLMPAMPQVAEEDLKAVAEFMYDSDMALPEWYKQHYKEEHGEEPKDPKKETQSE